MANMISATLSTTGTNTRETVAVTITGTLQWGTLLFFVGGFSVLMAGFGFPLVCVCTRVGPTSLRLPPQGAY